MHQDLQYKSDNMVITIFTSLCVCSETPLKKKKKRQKKKKVPGWPGTCYVAQGLKPSDLPASASQMLRLKVGTNIWPIVSNFQSHETVRQACEQETAESYLVTWQNSTEILSVMCHSRGNIRPYFSS